MTRLGGKRKSNCTWKEVPYMNYFFIYTFTLYYSHTFKDWDYAYLPAKTRGIRSMETVASCHIRTKFGLVEQATCVDAVRLVIIIGHLQIFHRRVVLFADVALVGRVGVVPLHQNECLWHGIFWVLDSFFLI